MDNPVYTGKEGGSIITDEQIKKLIDQGWTQQKIADRYGFTRGKVRRALARLSGGKRTTDDTDKTREGYEERKPKVFKDDDVWTIVSGGRSKHTVKISEDALRQLKKYYCLEKLTINQLCREMKLPRRDFYLIKTAFGITKDDLPYTDLELITQTEDELVVDSLQEKKRLYFVKLDQKEIEQLRKENNEYRKKDYFLNKAHELVSEHMPEFAKTYSGPTVIKASEHKKEFVIEPDVCDLHLGKLGYEPESGENYDYKIAKDRFNYIIDDVYARAEHMPVKKVLYPFGQDFWQINSKKGTTFAGTIVDADSRVQKLFTVGIQMHITAIDKFRQLGPVSVVLVPGNHDEEISFYALMYLAAWYKDAKDVEVWTDIKSRKYVWFGINLIGFAHGHQEGKRILGNMQVEAPEAWAKTRVREWHLAHKHRYQVQEENGVVVRELSALTGKDAWEFGMGFNGAITRTQTFVWHKEDGLYATWEKAIWSKNETSPVLAL
jgi:hypothetical protein